MISKVSQLVMNRTGIQTQELLLYNLWSYPVYPILSYEEMHS